MADSFSPGQHVRVEGYRAAMPIIEGPNKRGEYLVQHGQMKLWVAADKLSAAQEKQKKKKKLRKEVVATTPSKPIAIDLHGLTVEQAIEKLETTIDRALRENVSQLEIVHGIGSGAIKDAIRKYADASRHVASWKEDLANPGVTWLYL